MTPGNQQTARAKGFRAEKIALDYLQKKGLVLLRQNYTARGGEIDLIMQDKDVTAFIEVRYRSANNYLEAVETIDRRKCERIIRTSQYYLLSCKPAANDAFRFDVITVSGDHARPKIGWIKNAFEA